jgi:L-fucose mutarotase/ribose pyranase (RbsD/FucU family)
MQIYPDMTVSFTLNSFVLLLIAIIVLVGILVFYYEARMRIKMLVHANDGLQDVLTEYEILAAKEHGTYDEYSPELRDLYTRTKKAYGDSADAIHGVEILRKGWW